MSDLIPQVLREIKEGQGLGLAAATRTLPRGRGYTPLNISTVARWCLTGTKGPDGRRVYLEFVRVGGRMMTSGPALDRFIMALSEGTPGTSTPRSPAAARKASEAAAAELDRQGA